MQFYETYEDNEIVSPLVSQLVGLIIWLSFPTGLQ